LRAGRLANGLGIVAVVLLALAVRLDEVRAHEPRFMAELGDLSGPIVRATAGFHTHHAWLQLHQERQRLFAA